MTHEHASKSIRMLSLVMLGMLLAALLLPGWAQASPLQLPPRPPTPTAEPVSGGIWGAIQLQAVQPQMNAWIVVEWQDAQGGWHAVIGWQGGFDSISNGIGLKTWWVAPADWGKGPFRWQVYRSKGGKVLATSAPFDLPTRNRAIVKVGLAVAP